MGGNVKFNNSGQNNYTTAQEKIPEGYRPVSVNTPVAVFGGETTFICYGEANGTDLSVYPEDYLDAVAEELNDRPRKTLGFMKPSEKIIELLDAA